MTYTQAQDSIIKSIRTKVSILNRYLKLDNVDSVEVERLRNELRGMVFCLNIISSSNEVWCIDFLVDSTLFGYYDDSGQWIPVE